MKNTYIKKDAAVVRSRVNVPGRGPRTHLLPGKKQVICVILGLVLGIAAEVSSRLDGELTDGHILTRNSYGQGEAQYGLIVEGLEENEVPLNIEVLPRAYTREEAHRVYEKILNQIPEYILGDNVSLKEVRYDLNLITDLDQYGVRLRWESEDPELISPFGDVEGVGLKEEGQEVCLRVRLTDGQWPEEYQIFARVKPPLLSEQQEREKEFMNLVMREDERQRELEYLKLPLEFQGRALAYVMDRESAFWPMAGLGVTAAFMIHVKDKNDRNKVKNKRRQQMLLDYSEVLSRLIIFLGAGMSIRTAWDKIGFDYRRMTEEGRRGTRYIYEEMYETSCQMKGGVPEAKAFSEFGRRCGLQPYMKLTGLLEQNRKNGSKNLRDTLKIEMTEAFEQRKHEARRLGEEAGTKLLLPLFMLLSVVMIMIAVPALMEFR